MHHESKVIFHNFFSAAVANLFCYLICQLLAIICFLFIGSNLRYFVISQVVLQSETIQELTKTSEALALLQVEASRLRKLADAQKVENVRACLPCLQLFHLPFSCFVL